MKVLYLECNMGIAGDMLMSALWELVDDKENAMNDINNFGLPNINVSFENKITCGINGTHAKVICLGIEENEQIHNLNNNTLYDIKKIINGLNVSDFVKENSINTYDIIANAESKVHNCTIDNIHFHEVGTLDAIADVVICSYLINKLVVDEIIVSPINVGSGSVKCAHGVLPVPAPATANILIGIPTYSNDVIGELCTPTGSALVKNFADEFSSSPNMITQKIGYGIGTKEFNTANCVRAFLGESNDSDTIELACNIDDMTPEELSYACEVLMKNGALDVTQTPITMKKSRLGIMLSVICKLDDRDKILQLIFKHTTTIGVRQYSLIRYTLDRKIEKINTRFGSVDVKKSNGFSVSKEKIEFEDLKKIADINNLSINEVKKLIDK